jgi:hypothetical protein
MKSNFLAVLSVVLVLTMASTPVFAGSQGTSDVTWKIDRYSLLATSDLKTGHHAESSIYNIYDDVKPFTHISDPAMDFENNTLLATTDSSLRAAETIAEEKEGEMTADQIGELMANPFSYLWFGMIQNDTYWWDGDLLDFVDEDRKVMNTTLIQPVMSLQLTEKWKTIFRPVIPIQSFDTISGFDIIESEPEGPRISTDWDRETGLGDILLWTAFTKNYKPPFVWGFGPTIMMNTASDKWLGTGKWSAGPMGLASYISKKWIFACVAQHWWSFAGDSDRDSVNLTDFQPIIRYRLSPKTNIGLAPNIQYNWSADDSDDRLRLPIGGGISTVVMLGRLPVAIGAEAYYMVETPDTFGPEYQLRVFFTPVLPSPDWSRVPIFGH